MRLCELMEIKKGAVAMIGGGGKTTLMYTLANELEAENSVIVMTTTHIKPPDKMPVLLNPSEDDVVRMVSAGRAICAGKLNDEKKLCPPDIAVSRLIGMADYVLIEADGSKGLPMKAHESYEPVIPDEVNDVILVVGMTGIGKKVSEAAHRSRLYCQLALCSENDIITPEIAAEVINKEALHTKVFLNQIDAAAPGAAQKLARLIEGPVYSGALIEGEWECLC